MQGSWGASSWSHFAKQSTVWYVNSGQCAAWNRLSWGHRDAADAATSVTYIGGAMLLQDPGPLCPGVGWGWNLVWGLRAVLYPQHRNHRKPRHSPDAVVRHREAKRDIHRREAGRREAVPFLPLEPRQSRRELAFFASGGLDGNPIHCLQ